MPDLLREVWCWLLASSLRHTAQQGSTTSLAHSASMFMNGD